MAGGAGSSQKGFGADCMKRELRDGLLMNNSIILIDEKKPGLPIRTRIVQLLVILLGSWGSVGVFTDTVAIPAELWTVYLSLLLGILIVYGLCLIPGYDYVKLFFGLLFYGLFFGSRFSELRNGFYLLENKIIDRLTVYYGIPYFQYIAQHETAVRDSTLLMIMIAIPVSVLFTIAVARNRLTGLAGILAFLPITMSFLFGLVPSERYLLAYAAAVLYLSQASFSNHRITDSGQRMLLRRINSRAAVWMCLICLLVFSAFKLIITEKDYQNIDKIKETKTKIQTALLNFNINNYTDLFEDIRLFPSRSVVGGLDGGKLGNYSKVTFNNTEQLIITAPLEGISKGVYLKGYVGSEYTGSSWDSHNVAAKEAYEQLMQDIPANEFLPVNQTGQMLRTVNLGDYQTLYRTGTMRVDNIHANRKFIYVPYITDLDYTDNLKHEQDLYALPAKKLKSYEVLYYYLNPDADTLTQVSFANTINSAFSRYEESYRNYVKEYYTKMPSEGLERLKQDFGSENEEISDLDTSGKLTYVEDYLGNNTEYSLTPGRLPEGKDYIEYFLYENKKGYCAHYASAAVMMLRAMGVPARYVEGYAVGPSDVIRNTVTSTMEEIPANQVNEPRINVTVSVRDYNAHAWVEIYIDHIGWIPFDPTPGSSLGYIGWNQRSSLAYNTPAVTQPPATPTPRPTQAPQQEKPEITKAPAAASNNSDTTEQDGFDPLVIGIVLSFFAVIVIIMGLFIMGRKRSSRTGISKNRQAIHMYRNLNMLLISSGLLIKRGESLEDCEEQVMKDSLLFPPEDLSDFMEIIRKARFSNREITIEELRRVHWFYRNSFRKVYDRLSIPMKLYLKFNKI